MKKIGLLIVVFILSQTVARAQPGFMGKKFSFGYSFEALPYFNILNEKEVARGNNGDFKSAPFEIVTGHHLNLGATVSRRLELIAYAGVRNREIDHFPFDMLTINGEQVEVVASKGVKMRETFYDFGFRRYFKKYVAPVGFYHQFIFGQVNLQYTDDTAPIKVKAYSSNTTTISSVDPLEFKGYKFFRMTYGIGIKRMMNKFIFLNAEGNVHFNIKDMQNYDTYSGQKNKYLGALIESNFNYRRRFDFKLGLGVLF